MALPGSLQLTHGLGLCRKPGRHKHPSVVGRSKLHLLNTGPSYPLSFMKLDSWGIRQFHHINRPTYTLSYKSRPFTCHSLLVPSQPSELPVVKVAATLLARALEPVILPTETSQVIKERLLHFVRSLSTVLAFAYCLSSVIQQTQKFLSESTDPSETRNMGFQFAGKAVYSAVWIAAFSLFMELLGFSTQRWVTAGGLGTVLLTLAGREIFTNFLSSAMIHATRPFVINEWIQTKIEGYEVSGTVEHVGWWSPTIVRGEDGEAVHIPNHKFTVNVVRNLTQKTHWRIKTHLAISHLDVKKINNIVADMRKVLAKNPQVEQQRLHRRVFLDNINPENQALLILVSCFVKTSHFEEYLCVKEAILLDLLRVIGHHRARLATPVRTLQKIYSDAELDNIPYSDSPISGAGTVSNRPLLMIESPNKVSADDKAKVRSARAAGDQDNKATAQTRLETKVGSSGIQDDSEVDAKVATSNSNTNGNAKTVLTPKPDPEVGENKPIKPDSKGQAVKNIKPNIESESVVSSSGTGNVDKAGGVPTNTPTKQQGERKLATQPPPALSPASRPVLEENIVLGVALEGSKRTLPIEEGIETSATREAKEMAASHGGNGSPKGGDGNDKKNL